MVLLHGLPDSMEKFPPNLFPTFLIVASTVLSCLSAMITPSAPSARAVRHTWVVTLESLKNRCPIRRTTILPITRMGSQRPNRLNWRSAQYRVLTRDFWEHGV